MTENQFVILTESNSLSVLLWFCFLLLRGEQAAYIYIFIQTMLSSFRFVWLGLKRCLLLNCIQDGLTSLALQRHAGQTAVLQALTLGPIRSNDYSATKIFLNNFLLSTLSIMPTNLCSPSLQCHVILHRSY